MAVTTTDVVTNVVNGVEIPKNATTVISCQRTGVSSKLNTTFEHSLGYTVLEGKYTNRFYNGIFIDLVGNQTIVGG